LDQTLKDLENYRSQMLVKFLKRIFNVCFKSLPQKLDFISDPFCAEVKELLRGLLSVRQLSQFCIRLWKQPFHKFDSVLRVV